MNRFYDDIIKPILEIENIKNIVEIGAKLGENTAKLISYVRKNGGKVYSIDPCPDFPVEKWEKENNGSFIMLKDLSLNVIKDIKDADVFLIDGDHNWYTVYNELCEIAKIYPPERFPLVMFHDIGWPYDRRDLYYSPETIPDEFRHPYEKKAMRPDSDSLVESFTGINGSFFNAVEYGTPKNGVKTAVEDFVKNHSELKLKFYMLEALHGLGMIVNPELHTGAVEYFTSSEALKKVVRLGENDRIKELINKNDLKHQINELTPHIVKAKLYPSYKGEGYSEDTAVVFGNYDPRSESFYGEYTFDKAPDRVRFDPVGGQFCIAEDVKAITEKGSITMSAHNGRDFEGFYIFDHFDPQFIFENSKKARSFRIKANIHTFVSMTEFEMFNKAAETFDKRNDEINRLDDKLKTTVNDNNAILGELEKVKKEKIRLETEMTDLKNEKEDYERKDKEAEDELKKLKEQAAVQTKKILDLENQIVRDKNTENILRQEANRHVNSVRYRVGTAMVDAAQSPKALFSLPGRLIRIYRDRNNAQTPPVVQGSSITSTQAQTQAKKLPLNLESYSYSENKAELFYKIPRDKFVSIIMPTWNRKNIIGKSVQSVLNQTYREFELIIVDDGSTDNTEEYIKSEFFKEIVEERIIFIRIENSGVCVARNEGIKRAKGEYVAYLDSDNCWHSDYLETMIKAFLDHPGIQSAYGNLNVINKTTGQNKVRNSQYNRKILVNQNFIDMNVFMHKRCLYAQYGGFDTSLKRLVDWELIIRYTRQNPPFHVKKILVDYYEDNNDNRITNNISLDDNRLKVLKKHRRERTTFGYENLNVAYILWDYPAASQTFVFNEIKYLIEKNINVKVFYVIDAQTPKTPDFDIKAYRVNDYIDLSYKLIENDIDYMHAHFAYPTAYQLAYKASKSTGIPYSFAAHAVDIFLYVNDGRNHVGEVGSFGLCEKVLVPGGKYHLDFLRSRGVPGNKIAVTNQAIAMEFYEHCLENMGKFKSFDNKITKIVAIGRFIEKKGFEYLIKAAAYLDKSFSIDIYGFGNSETERSYKQLIKEYDKHNIVKICGSISSAMDCLKTADFLAAPCVVAENGDIDGMPTVILEAMSMGVLVVATEVSSIPYIVKNNFNGFVTKPRNEKALADTIIRASCLSPEEKNLIVQNAYCTVGDNEQTHTMASVLYNNIMQKSITIFLVTYCAGDFIETTHIIDNIFEKTVSSFCLTIVDNNSPNKEFIDYLHELEHIRKNVNVIFSKENLQCGPASNLALENIHTEYAVYICSNEGYPIEYGWESRFVDYMNNHNNCAIAGGMSYSPKMCTIRSYKESDIFTKFRNKNYIDNIEEPIRFVQGGIYILRMSAFKKVGGFSKEFPQGHMDVEYSYYLRSCGYDIGRIDGVYAGTVKTLPKPLDFVNDASVAVHPYNYEALKRMDKTISDGGNICNICNYQGKFADGVCPQCGSTGSDRCLYQYIGENMICYSPDFPVDFSGYKTDCAKFTERLKAMFKKRGEDIIIFNSPSVNISSANTAVFVCEDIADADKLVGTDGYVKTINQYYSKCADFDKSRIITFRKKRKG